MKNHYLTFLLFILLFWGCNRTKVDKTIVLQIGKLSITEYEVDKNISRMLAQSNGEKVKNETSKLKKEYLDKCFIIADAYEQQFDTIKSLQKNVQQVSDFMMLQKYGYLWKYNVSPIVDTFKIVDEIKATKRKKLFYFDLIACDNVENLLKVNGDTILRNLKDFNTLKSKCHLYDFLSTSYGSNQWPFLTFWKYRDYLFHLKEGQISRLLKTKDACYFLYLDHIESIEVTKKDKENLQAELQIGIENEIDDNTTEEIIAHTKPIIYDKNITAIVKFMSEGGKITDYTHNIQLMQYTINGTIKTLDFNTFLENYNSNPFKSEINNKKTLIEYIDQYRDGAYLKNEAEQLGLYKVDSFLLDQKNYYNNIIFQEYLKRNILDKISINYSEILNFYSANQSNFTQPKTIILNLYTFNSFENAMAGRQKILEWQNKENSNKGSDSLIKGLTGYKPGFKLDLEKCEGLPGELIEESLKTKANSLSNKPIKDNNKYIVFFKKEENGQCVKNIGSVYSQIENYLKTRGMNIKVAQLVPELRKKYKVEINKTDIE